MMRIEDRNCQARLAILRLCLDAGNGGTDAADIIQQKALRQFHDADRMGGADVATRSYETRYMAACRIYLDEEDPRSRASILVDHDDPLRPRVIERSR